MKKVLKEIMNIQPQYFNKIMYTYLFIHYRNTYNENIKKYNKKLIPTRVQNESILYTPALFENLTYNYLFFY